MIGSSEPTASGIPNSAATTTPPGGSSNAVYWLLRVRSTPSEAMGASAMGLVLALMIIMSGGKRAPSLQRFNASATISSGARVVLTK